MGPRHLIPPARIGLFALVRFGLPRCDAIQTHFCAGSDIEGLRLDGLGLNKAQIPWMCFTQFYCVSVESENHGCGMPRLLPQSRARACRIPGRSTAGVALLAAESRKHATSLELRLRGGQRRCASWLPRSGAGGAGMRLSSFVSSSGSALSGRPPPPGLCLGCLGPQVEGHASAGRAVAAPPAAIGQEPPGPSPGAGGADRPQPLPMR